MKKVIILVFCWVAVHSCVIAQGFQFVYGTKEIAPGLILSATSDGYSIDYTLPEFNEVVVHTECGTFSTICFVGDDDFSEMDSTGMPALPIKSVNLQIPSSDSSVTYHMFPPTHTGYSIYDPYTYIQLQHPYCPAMEMLEDSSAVCKMNEGFYYSDTWYSCDVTNNVFVSERYRYLGCVGVSVNLFPVEYNPKQKLVRIPKRIRLNIDVPLQSLNAELQFKYNPVTFFDSWWSFCVPDTISGGSGKKGRLLIVTLPEFEQALIEYCRYKDATGYIVDIQADENFRQSVKVRNLLMNAYHSNSRPDFVLIVGSPLLIPYSDGIRDKYNNPLTDIYYACLEKSNISKEPMSPDVCVGRWPVSSVTDIYNIALKTIIFEQEIVNYQKSVSLFSGIGKGQNLFFLIFKKLPLT
ncbi:MAG: C25 family cysteine peptidase [Candidatus Aphodosoma sp.]